MRLLVAEDDAMIGASLRDALRAEGYAVDWVEDGNAADTALRTHHYELAVLDLGLPGLGGLQVLQAMRARHDATPVLVLTARDGIRDRVGGLDSGADDYLVKPFDLDELLARLRALLRRAAGRAEPVFEAGPVRVDPAQRVATVAGVPVTLSGREWAVLQALIARPGAVLSRAAIEEKLYGWGEEIDSNAVEVYVHGLRRKLGATLIRTVRGVGYAIDGGAAG